MNTIQYNGSSKILQRLCEAVNNLISDEKDVGVIYFSINSPTPANEWIICDGREIPSQYTELRYIIRDGYVPNLQLEGINAYIYAGQPNV